MDAGRKRGRPEVAFGAASGGKRARGERRGSLSCFGFLLSWVSWGVSWGFVVGSWWDLGSWALGDVIWLQFMDPVGVNWYGDWVGSVVLVGEGSRFKVLDAYNLTMATTGCPFGEGCHFLHYFPGGYQAVAQMTNLGGPAITPPPGRMPAGLAVPDGPPAPAAKTRMCNKYNTAEGCKWGNKCHFAHGERELGKPVMMDNLMLPPMGPRPTGRFDTQSMPGPGIITPTSFGASATAKISVDASLAGGIIGRGGVNTKHICRITGAKLAIRDHESDPNFKNIELEGTFDQIKNASAMVKELIVSIGGNAPPPAKSSAGVSRHAGGPRNNLKTKLCENFTKGSCTFGDRCNFAHGENELRRPAAA